MATPSKYRILVVDDEPSVRDIVAELLRSAGYEVVTAQDGFGALLQLRKMVPDLIVSDLNMPHMSGYELLSVIRRRFPQILSLAMSADYMGNEVPSGVIADSFFSQGQGLNIRMEAVAALIETPETWLSAHQKEHAPAWVRRNGNDAHGIPYVIVTCAECLRVFQLPLPEDTGGKVLEAPCRFCPGKNRYIIEPEAREHRGAVYA